MQLTTRPTTHEQLQLSLRPLTILQSDYPVRRQSPWSCHRRTAKETLDPPSHQRSNPDVIGTQFPEAIRALVNGPGSTRIENFNSIPRGRQIVRSIS